MCEKPVGANLEQANDFLALQDRFAGQKILVAENFLYRDDLRLARSLLDADAIGRLHLMSWRLVLQTVPREGSFASTPWRWAPQYRGGPLLDADVHHVAQMRLLCGDIQELHAFIQYANPRMGGPSDLVLNVHFVSHAIGNFTAAHLALPSFDEPNAMRLYGADGVLIVGGRGDRGVRIQRADGTREAYTVECDNGYYNEWLNFYEAIVFDEPIIGTIAQSYTNFMVIMCALDAAEGQRLESLQSLPGGLSQAAVPLWRPRGQRDLFGGLPCRVRHSPQTRKAAS
jgi:predicted dehydrogenase